jgi:hypothetical protein
MKIYAITLIRLRNDAYFQFQTEFKELAEKQTPEALKKGRGKNSTTGENP